MKTKCFYCHFEERKSRQRVYNGPYVSNSQIRKGDNWFEGKDRYIPRAVCDKCLKAGRTLAVKFNKDGLTKPKYTEFSNFRG
jgi:hypothetical protein